VQKALDEGRLKFGEKTKQLMQVDVDPLKNADSMYAEVIGINMVDIAEKFDSELPIEEQVLEENPPVDDEMVTEAINLPMRWLLRTNFSKKWKWLILKLKKI